MIEYLVKITRNDSNLGAQDSGPFHSRTTAEAAAAAALGQPNTTSAWIWSREISTSSGEGR